MNYQERDQLANRLQGLIERRGTKLHQTEADLSRQSEELQLLRDVFGSIINSRAECIAKHKLNHTEPALKERRTPNRSLRCRLCNSLPGDCECPDRRKPALKEQQ